MNIHEAVFAANRCIRLL